MKPKQKKDIEEFEDIEDDEDDEIDVDDSGPRIASGKNSKVILIAVSSLLITVVLYLFFLKGNGDGEIILQEVPTLPSAPIEQNREKSSFDLDEVSNGQGFSESTLEGANNIKEEADLVKKPEAPETPEIPSLPDDLVLPEQIFANDEISEINNNNLRNSDNNNASPNQAIGDLPNLVIPSNNQPLPNTTNSSQAGFVTNNNLNPRYSDIIVFNGPTEGSPARGIGYENNIVTLNQDPIEALDASPTSVAPTHIANLAHTIAQGKLLTAVIETAINTEVPGFVRGLVSRDVYAEAGNEVLIPRGTRLFGSYSSQINQGQGRVEISWTRLIRPDGVDISVSFNASDQFGRSGIAGDVDNKYGSIIAGSLLTSLLAVGGAAAAEAVLSNDSVTTTTDPTNGTTTTTGSATNQVISDVSSTIVDTIGELITNKINTNPVIRIPQGTRITVIVNTDITLPPMKRR